MLIFQVNFWFFCSRKTTSTVYTKQTQNVQTILERFAESENGSYCRTQIVLLLSTGFVTNCFACYFFQKKYEIFVKALDFVETMCYHILSNVRVAFFAFFAFGRKDKWGNGRTKAKLRNHQWFPGGFFTWENGSIFSVKATPICASFSAVRALT